jgi:hypothetical protein
VMIEKFSLPLVYVQKMKLPTSGVCAVTHTEQCSTDGLENVKASVRYSKVAIFPSTVVHFIVESWRTEMFFIVEGLGGYSGGS